MITLPKGLALNALLLLALIYSAAAQTGSGVTELEPNRPVERTIAPGDSHVYSVKLTRGQVMRLIADQRGVDIVVRAFAPDGAKLGEFDSPNGAQGPETVTLFAETPGTYRFEIAPLGGPAGRYEIKVVELRAATKDEVERHKAEQEVLLQLERPWDDANRLMDTEALARLMADDYLAYSVTNRGANKDKQGHLNETAQRKTASQNVTVRHETDDVTARVYGDTAMVTGRVVITSTVNGREQKFPGRFVHVWLRRGGRWQIAGDMFFAADPLPLPRTAVKVDPHVYDAYMGQYDLGGDVRLILTKAGDNLLAQIGQFQDSLYPESDSEFFSKSQDLQVTFVRDAKGDVTHIIMTQSGRASKVPKIREKPTQ